jgi:MFS family permease
MRLVHPVRCGSDAALRHAGRHCPIPASSGQTLRVRLSRSGDRHLNQALHLIVLTRLRYDPATSAAGGVGGASGPLIGGLITSAISWRAAFVFQALVIAAIVWLARRVQDPLPPDPSRSFDTGGAILSAVGLVLVVMGILAADNNGWLMLALLAVGALVLAWFFRSGRAKERAGQEPLLSTELFRNRTSNLGLVTQNTQWLLLMGISFVVAAFLQVVRGYDAIQTGVIFTAATVGLLASSLGAERLAKRRPQRTLIKAGFLVTIAGIGVLLAMVIGSPSVWAFAPGLLLIGLGLGLMLTPSVNVVQSSFPEQLQGEISGLSRSVSNLGSSLGTAIAGTILVAGITATPGRSYGLAMIVLATVGLLGLAASALLPRTAAPADAPAARPGPRGTRRLLARAGELWRQTITVSPALVPESRCRGGLRSSRTPSDSRGSCRTEHDYRGPFSLVKTAHPGRV